MRVRVQAKLLLCLTLAGCADGACTPPQEDSEVPLMRFGGQEIAPVLINGEATGLVLDTGASGTTVTPQAVQDLKLETHTIPFQITGIGGTTFNQATIIDQLKVGGAEVSDAAALVVPLSKQGLDNYPAYGLLGEDLLTDWDIDLDAAHNKLTLYEPQQCGVPVPPWSGPTQAVDIPRALTGPQTESVDIAKGFQPVTRRQSTYTGQILFPVTLDGHVLTAQLDTGASRSLVRPDAVGLSAQALAGDPVHRANGVNLLGIETHRHRFADLQIGTTDYGPITIGVGASQLRGADMLLGEDFLRHHDVYVAFHAGKLFIARNDQ